MSKQVVRLLKELNWKIAAAESCTAGAFSAAIADTPGASEVMEMGFVTYSEAAKEKLVGVSQDNINRYGVVSEEVAIAMAAGAANVANTEVGIGITGYAGPGGGTEKAPVGTIYVGFCINGQCSSIRINADVSKGRNSVREEVVDTALSCLEASLTEYLKLKDKHEPLSLITDNLIEQLDSVGVICNVEEELDEILNLLATKNIHWHNGHLANKFSPEPFITPETSTIGLITISGDLLWEESKRLMNESSPITYSALKEQTYMQYIQNTPKI